MQSKLCASFQRKTYMQSAFPCFYISIVLLHISGHLFDTKTRKVFILATSTTLAFLESRVYYALICAPTFINNTTICQSTSSISNQCTCYSGRMQLFILQIVSISTLKKRILHKNYIKISRIKTMKATIFQSYHLTGISVIFSNKYRFVLFSS